MSRCARAEGFHCRSSWLSGLPACCVQPVVEVAALLIEPSGSSKGAAACYHPDGHLEAGTASPAVRAADLGTRMLLELFDTRRRAGG